MAALINHPRVFCVVSFLAMALMAWLGRWANRRFHRAEEQDKEMVSLVLSATLTLLGLIIGFSFSMATSRYDQRKQYEEEEANAIGTEYVRLDLLPDAQSAAAKQLMLGYLQERIEWYSARDESEISAVNRKTAQVQDELWAAVRPEAITHQTPVTALVASGMNDVLNSQGYTQAAWWNRLPTSAWMLMLVMALFANLLLGASAKISAKGRWLLLVVPAIISIALFLVGDIDSPRTGRIRIRPQNLMSLSESLQPQSR